MAQKQYENTVTNIYLIFLIFCETKLYMLFINHGDIYFNVAWQSIVFNSVS
jgi:hypothetical protein